jgi:hypothetical protein
MKPFADDIRLQARILRGQIDLPWSRQFVGLTPGIYELKNLFLYTLGPALLLSGLAGTVDGARQAVARRDIAWAIPLLWIVAYVPTLLITEARFLRYMLPVVPFCAVFAGALLVRLPRLGRFPTARFATASVLIVTAIWAVGFTSMYAKEHPRIAASRWMHANIPAESAITAESWDDAMPVPYPDAPPSSYELVSSDIYQDEPPEQKVASIAATLEQADYVILSSDRVIASVDNLPWRYAVQNEYYRRLLAGQLGFQLVYDGELRPELFGYRFDDSASDESFTVYDHPRVRIFKTSGPSLTGVNVFSSWPMPTRYRRLQGTSMATPHVAGAAAVLLSAGAGSPDEVKTLLFDGAKDLGAPGWDSKYGHGRLDLGKALQMLVVRERAPLFGIAAAAAFLLSLLTGARVRFVTMLAAALTAGGAFFLAWLPVPPNAATDLLALPILEWPSVLGRFWVGFPLWLSVLVPLVGTFVFGATRSLGPLTAGVLVGVGTHLVWGGVMGTLHPWGMAGSLALGWLVVNGVLTLGLALATLGVTKLRDRKGGAS